MLTNVNTNPNKHLSREGAILSVSRIDMMLFNDRNNTPRKVLDDKETKSSFDEHLKQGIKRVNDLQLNAEQEIGKLVTGDVEDISQVVTAVAEAEIALRLFVEVRDKLVDAYQQLSRIPV
jgi:flagellar hook-basal body complex protein FliE